MRNFSFNEIQAIAQSINSVTRKNTDNKPFPYSFVTDIEGANQAVSYLRELYKFDDKSQVNVADINPQNISKHFETGEFHGFKIKGQDCESVTVHYDSSKITPEQVHDLMLFRTGKNLKSKDLAGNLANATVSEYMAQLETLAHHVVMRGHVTQYLTPYGKPLEELGEQPLSLVTYYNVWPKLTKDYHTKKLSGDFNEFCSGSHGQAIIKDQAKLKDKYKSIMSLLVQVASENKEAVSLVAPSAFLAGLRKDQQDIAKQLFKEALLEVASETKKTNCQGIFVNNLKLGNDERAKIGIPVVENTGDAIAPQRIAKGKLTVANSINGEPLRVCGGGFDYDSGMSALEERMTRLTLGGTLIYSPSFNNRLLDEAQYKAQKIKVQSKPLPQSNQLEQPQPVAVNNPDHSAQHSTKPLTPAQQVVADVIDLIKANDQVNLQYTTNKPEKYHFYFDCPNSQGKIFNEDLLLAAKELFQADKNIKFGLQYSSNGNDIVGFYFNNASINRVKPILEEQLKIQKKNQAAMPATAISPEVEKVQKDKMPDGVAYDAQKALELIKVIAIPHVRLTSGPSRTKNNCTYIKGENFNEGLFNDLSDDLKKKAGIKINYDRSGMPRGLSIKNKYIDEVAHELNEIKATQNTGLKNWLTNHKNEFLRTTALVISKIVYFVTLPVRAIKASLFSTSPLASNRITQNKLFNSQSHISASQLDPKRNRTAQDALDCIKNTTAITRMLDIGDTEGWGFELGRLANPGKAEYRKSVKQNGSAVSPSAAVLFGDLKNLDFSEKYDIKAGKFKPIDPNKKHGQSKNTDLTKKVAASLLSQDANIGLFDTKANQHTIGLIYNFEHCELTDLIFKQNALTWKMWWYKEQGKDENPLRAQQMAKICTGGIKELQDYVNTEAPKSIASGNGLLPHNELMVKLRLAALEGISLKVPPPTVSNDEKYVTNRCQGIVFKWFVEQQLGIELPIVFIGTGHQPREYTPAEQEADLKAFLKNLDKDSNINDSLPLVKREMLNEFLKSHKAPTLSP